MSDFRPTKLLRFAYWTLRRIFRAIYDDGLDDFKAQVAVSVTDLLGAMTLLSLASLRVGHQILPSSKAGTVGLGLGLTGFIVVANYFIFSKQKMVEFESEFRSYSVLARTIGGIVVVSFIVFVAAAAGLAGSAASRLPH